MARPKYIAITFLTAAFEIAFILWLCGNRATVGLDPYLPRKSRAIWVLAMLMVVAWNLWRRFANPVLPRGSRGLNRRMAIGLLRMFYAIMIVCGLRLLVPVITTGWFPADLRLRGFELLLWTLAIYTSHSLYRLLPLFMGHPLASADDVLAADPRKPVLYFRSFDKERKTASPLRELVGLRRYMSFGGIYERGFWETWNDPGYRLAFALDSHRSAIDDQLVLADVFRSIGPYVALGRPDEGFKDADLGAAKKYVAHDDWRDAVGQWLCRCKAVVLEAADSCSLGWEIEQVVRSVAPGNIVSD